jgi:hypothetical protein
MNYESSIVPQVQLEWYQLLDVYLDLFDPFYKNLTFACLNPQLPNYTSDSFEYKV